MLLALLTPAFAVEVLNADPPGAFNAVTLDVGGFVQPTFRYTQPDARLGASGELGFSVPQVRADLEGAFIAEKMGFRGELAMRWALTMELMPEPYLQDAYVDLQAGTPLTLRLGQQKAPSSRSFMVPDGKVLFPDRATLTGALPAREIGISALGHLGYKVLEYQVGVFNGEGQNLAQNENQRFLTAWRVVASPKGGPGTTTELMGLRQDDTFSVGYMGSLNFRGPEGAQRADFAHGAELFGHWRYFTGQAELHWKQTDWELKGETDFTMLGGYVQGAMFIPAPQLQDHLAVLARYEQLDPYRPERGELELDGPTDPRQATRDYTGGLGLYAGEPLFMGVQAARVVVAYTHKQELDGGAYRNDELVVGANINF